MPAAMADIREWHTKMDEYKRGLNYEKFHPVNIQQQDFRVF